MFRKFLCLALVLFAMPIHTQILNLPQRIEISEGWTFRQAHTGEWRPTKMPASSHTALLQNGLIEDPFYRDNESKLQWIEQEDWEFQCTFRLNAPALQHRHLELVFKGLDTYAQVFLNDSLILETDNVFRRWTADVKHLLREGENHLHVYFESPVKKVQPAWEALGYELPGGPRVMTRKAQYQYGWDWGPRFVGSGILKAPELVMWDDLLLEDAFVTTRSIDADKARMVINIRYRADFEGPVTLVSRDGKRKTIEDRRFYPGVHEDSMTFDVPDPKLWWCVGQGEPNMYDVNFEVKRGTRAVENVDLRYGIRTIELVTEPDGKGSTFYFRLNGRPVYAKGANLIPLDMFQDRVHPGRYKELVEAVADANMNMIRVWGGGVYEDDLLYQLCDARGILVWQDFMFACAMYPGDGAFLKNAAQEAYDQILRLRQHPCIALWCGNNECNEAWHNWGWQMKFTEAQREKIWRDYQNLFQDLLPVYVENYSLGVPYFESSPKHGRMHNKSMLEGDAHYWGVWHDEEPFEVLNHKVPRFMSEFGFQSFPAWETIEAFTQTEDRRIDSPVMLVHQKHPRGNALIAEYMKRAFTIPTNFEDFVYLSQVLQADGMRVGLEAQRRHKPYCMGSLYWQLNDVWPVASWSSIDYYGRWKALHYAAKRAFSPVAVLPLVEEDRFNAYAVSDLPDSITAKLEIRLMQFDGKMLTSTTVPAITLKPDSARLYWSAERSEWAGKKTADLAVVCRLLTATDSILHQNIAYFAPPKKQNLPKADILMQEKTDGEQVVITLRSDKLARSVYLRSSVEGLFSDNFFDLLPGEAHTVVFYPKKGNNIKPNFSVRHLRDAMP